MTFRLLIALPAVLLWAAGAWGFSYGDTTITDTTFPSSNSDTLGFAKSPADTAHWQAVRGNDPIETSFWALILSYPQDSAHANGDGDATNWIKYPADSSYSGCIRREVQDTLQYWYVTTNGNGYTWVQTDIDTTVSYDSLRLVESSRSSGTSGNHELGFDTSGTDVILDTFLTGGDWLYVTATSRIIDVSTWTNAALAGLEIGIGQIDNVPFLGQYQVCWFFVETFERSPEKDAACIVRIDPDTTRDQQDSIGIFTRGTHTGDNYLQADLMGDTGALFTIATVEFPGDHDTLYAVADGDTSLWTNGTCTPCTDSNWTMVDERVAANGDYVQTATPGETQMFHFQDDTLYSATLDSIVFLTQSKSAANDTLVYLIDTAGSVVAFDSMAMTSDYVVYRSKALTGITKTQLSALQFGIHNENSGTYRTSWVAMIRHFSDNIYATRISYVDVSGWSGKLIDSLKIGMKHKDDPDPAESLKVCWMGGRMMQLNVLDGTGEAGAETAHKIYSDSMDFWSALLSEAQNKDDNWNGAIDSVGAVYADSEAIVLYVVEADSVFHPWDGEEDVDSAFLNVPIIFESGNNYSCELWAVFAAADSTTVTPSTGFRVGYNHTNWVNRQTTGPVAWSTAGIKGRSEAFPFFSDTIYTTGYTNHPLVLKFDVTNLIKEIGETPIQYSICAFYLKSTNGDTSTVNYFRVGGVQPFAGAGDSTWLDIYCTSRTSAAAGGEDPNAQECLDASCVKIRGVSTLAIGSISPNSFVDKYWNENTVIIGRYNSMPTRMVVHLRDTTVITHADSIPDGATIDSAKFYAFQNTYSGVAGGKIATSFPIYRPTAGGASVYSDDNSAGEPASCSETSWAKRLENINCGSPPGDVAWLAAGCSDSTGTIADSADKNDTDTSQVPHQTAKNYWFAWDVTEWADSVYRHSANYGDGLLIRSSIEERSTPTRWAMYRTADYGVPDQSPTLLIWYTAPAAGDGINTRRRRIMQIGLVEDDSCNTVELQSSSLSSWDAESPSRK
ncbi:MAG: hypothetical protein ACYS30_20605 [Planctomycetota bacterium]|jgi:hypothetical protein